MNIQKTKRQKAGGRAKGTQNKVTREIKDFYKELIEKNLYQIETDLMELSPKDRLEIILKLSEFIVPKLQRSHQVLNTYDLIGMEAEFV
jgi:hypothetical protein